MTTDGLSQEHCVAALLNEIEITPVYSDGISELVWQALICAYLNHDGWRDVAEALFLKLGYTLEEIVTENGTTT